MKTLKLIFILLLTTGAAALAQNPIFYSISFPNAAHHEAEVVINIPAAPTGIIKARMSRSSAGRYATHEFGKNIYNVKAANGDGSPLVIKQLEGDVYEIAGN